MPRLLHRTLWACLLTVCTAAFAPAADWPMWRYDAKRTGASPQILAPKLHLQWAREYPPLKPAWPDQAMMQFDVAYEPVVAGQLLFINSSRHDCVRCLDTRSGQERWTFFADGPVRFAPVVWESRVYFTSDDGYLYCVEAPTGKEVWKFRGGPGDRKILGNERLISTWPARGAPVIADGTVYFAASIWPFMGVFVHALDARTGNVIWTNDADGSLYIKQPHNTDSFAGVAPQGPMVVIGNRLLVPGGRSVPACLDRKTGKLLRYQLAENGKRGGGSEVCAQGNLFFNGGAVFELSTEKYVGDFAKQVVLTPDVVYALSNGVCKAVNPRGPILTDEDDPVSTPPPAQEPPKSGKDDAPLDAEKEKAAKEKAAKEKEAKEKEKQEKAAKAKLWAPLELASCKAPGAEAIIKAGSRIYVGGQDKVLVIDPDLAGKRLTIAAELAVQGTVVRLIAADDRLFAVTREGRIYCFGGEETTPTLHGLPQNPPAPRDFVAELKASSILKSASASEGYAVMWGIGDGKLLRELVRQSKLHFIVIEPSEEKVAKWRARLTKQDLYGSRVCIVPGRPLSVTLPPYVASLMVCEDLGVIGGQSISEFLAKAFVSLRPFGGSAYFDATPVAQEKLAGVVGKLQGAKLNAEGAFLTLTREGALAGSGNWTHENADPANTRVSPDQLVKAPLGVLWFGGPSHEGILPRHGHGPQPQVIDGRLIIEGVDLLRAIDIYTGRLLWESPIPGLGDLYNNVAHQPGANATGSNFVCTSDCIYVAHKNACIRLDPRTGAKVGEFRLPKSEGETESPRWGALAVSGNYLIGGADPLFDPKLIPPAPKTKADEKKGDDPEPKATGGSLSKVLKSFKGFNDNYTASRHLVVMDRHNGKVLWQVAAQYGFRHNATCIGNGRLYTIDRLSGDQVAKIKLKDEEPPAPRLRVFDLKTGQELWSTDTDVFGTWLSYSVKHDVLIESGHMTRDSLLDEARGMRAYQGADGKVLWHDKTYLGPGMIHGDAVLQDQGGCDILTGKLKMREDPITGQLVPWKWARNYGCNTPAASEHLLTFRSGAAGYFDLCNDGGTGNFGGFRSSCTNNLVVAGGVLTVPEYTRTCTCAYQNQTSVGLVHMPEAEMWTCFGTKEIKGPVQRLGLTFGAPGDRRAENGTLWLEYPSTGGMSPAVSVKTRPANPEVFRHHSSFVEGPSSWVAASGFKGVNEVVIGLGDGGSIKRKFTVRLVFAEPDNIKAGERVFDVKLQGAVVLQGFDIVKEAGGTRRSLVKEFTDVPAGREIVIGLTPSTGARVRTPILSGVEIIAEKK